MHLKWKATNRTPKHRCRFRRLAMKMRGSYTGYLGFIGARHGAASGRVHIWLAA